MPPAPPEERDEGFKGISPFLGYGPERECAAQRKTLRYFRDWGLDVTSEHSVGGKLEPATAIDSVGRSFVVMKIPRLRHIQLETAKRPGDVAHIEMTEEAGTVANPVAVDVSRGEQ